MSYETIRRWVSHFGPMVAAARAGAANPCPPAHRRKPAAPLAEIRPSVRRVREQARDHNIFDEMKNQWAWGGYTTHDLARCPACGPAACALLQLVEHLRSPRRSRPASRGDHQPAAVSLGDRDRTRHARQTTIRVTNSHAKAEPAAKALAAVAAFLRGLARNAEQLTRLETWRAILSRAFQAFPQGPPPPPATPPRPQLMQPKREN